MTFKAPATLTASPASPASPYRWDLFCSVIDNFGDIGICWRLARQLALEHQQELTLWVDDLASFQRICPDINPRVLSQNCRGVNVRFWSPALPPLGIADLPDIVIEAFACTLPQSYIRLMAECPKPPLWLNIEYLSAEDWVADCHTLSSPLPNYKLHRKFFFPGFTANTGGLLREQNLLQERDAFQQNKGTQAAFWQSIAMQPPADRELRISLFGYDNPVDELLALWLQSSIPITVCAAEGALATRLQKKLYATSCTTPPKQKGPLQLKILPFLEQDRYDRLLWACDINFVRGEDSFVRAQWACKPFVWHIYRQEENAHLAKLDAFMDRYTKEMPPTAANTLRSFWKAWNTGKNITKTWPAFIENYPRLDKHAFLWSKKLLKSKDFATNLMLYCKTNL
jgi:uncharacterized repeat protein (TIGR03837 family)